MKNRSTGRLGLLLNVVIPGVAARSVRGSQPLKNTTRFPIKTFGNDVARGYLRGFTLIELLVVVLIIGILSSIALPQYTKAVMKSRYSTLMATVDALAAAEEVYYLENGHYTDDFEALAVRASGCSLSADKRSCTYEWGSCRLLDPNGNDRVVCVNNTSLKNGYAHYFPHGNLSSWGRVCWALTEDRNDKYAKLCENMGGSYTGHDELIGFGNGFYYKF